MKTKILWFLMGFVASWLTWSVINYVRYRPRDYTESWPQVIQELDTWLKSAHGRQLGNLRIFIPADLSKAEALIHPSEPNDCPCISILDENDDGRIDGVMICDSAERSVSVYDMNSDEVFDCHHYSTGVLGADALLYTDDNMDGQYDYRAGSDGTIAVWINSQWREQIFKGDKRHVELDGTPRELAYVDGIWTLAEEEQPIAFAPWRLGVKPFRHSTFGFLSSLGISSFVISPPPARPIQRRSIRPPASPISRP